MNKLVIISLISGIIVGSNVTNYSGSTTPAVILAGSIIKAKQSDNIDKKYKRKDCPVCKGKGWYISGDGIKKVECGYCEPETQLFNQKPKIIKK